MSSFDFCLRNKSYEYQVSTYTISPLWEPSVSQLESLLHLHSPHPLSNAFVLMQLHRGILSDWHLYSSIPSSDSPKAEDGTTSRPNRRRLVCFIVILLLLSGISALLIWSNGLSYFTANDTHGRFSSGTRHCGNSSTRAEELGCIFDFVGMTWTPPACYDSETVAEFEDWAFSSAPKHGPFPYFTDGSAEHRFPDKEAMSHHQGHVWTTYEGHLTHCMYVERRLHRALRGNFGLDSRHRRYRHAVHCSDVVLDQLGGNGKDLESINTRFGIGFETCEIA